MTTHGGLARVWNWLSNDPRYVDELGERERDYPDWLRTSAFIGLHIACLAAIWVGVSPIALLAALLSYLIRMFFVTAFYHRYFSHRAYRVSRGIQFLMALLGCTAGQRGPLWWAGHHREHHAHADTPADPHSPLHKGFVFAHMLWFLTRGSFVAPRARVQDWRRFPELVWLDRLDWVPFVLYMVGCFALGEFIAGQYPDAGTSGWQMLVWAGLIATVILYHATYTINSLAHRYGSRRFETRDGSRNNWWLALLTLGEGWHNNHHRYPAAARQGFFWWEIDPSYWLLRLGASLGLLRDLKPVPERVLAEAEPARLRFRGQ